ncbi:MAG: hypothetical protein RL637_156 [Pseudomonadota bacterium]
MLPRLIESQGFNQLVKAKYGYVVYNQNDIYIGRAIEKYGEFSEAEVDLFRQICKSGDIVVEVGANIGTHTQVLSQLVRNSAGGGRIIAFEPQRIVFQTLCANMAINSITNVECYPFAVGEKAGDLLLPDMNYHQQGNFGGVEINRFTQGQKVQIVSLDEFLTLPALKLLKIDVEGMEHSVISGAKQLITLHKPFLYVENDRLDKSQALIELIFSLNYRLFWHKPKLFNPNNYTGCLENDYPNVISINMLGIPRNLSIELREFEEITDPSFHPLRR